MNLVDAVRKWATLAPDRTVVVDSTTDRRITFEELLGRVIQLSNGFASLGLAKGDRVAVLSTNSIEYFEVYYACAMSGLIAQPINWRLSAEEITRIIEDGEPSVFICQKEFLDLQHEVRATVTSNITYLEYGPETDGSYEALVTQASTEDLYQRYWRRRPSTDPVHRWHNRTLQRSPAYSPQPLHGNAQSDRCRTHCSK